MQTYNPSVGYADSTTKARLRMSQTYSGALAQESL